MPIIKWKDFGTDQAPSWAKVECGIVAMGCSTRDKTGSVELHFHDAEEYWFVINGKARVMTEGKEYLVEKGDIVCTHKGDEHAILEVVEAPYTQVWIECNLRGKKRTGHLHRGKDD
ncbi:cupin domain-containing protein [Candidatus Poribacteria bacterium]|nr:cupin domain-containing protein [Candidatus Poribacteria bacterium]